MVLGVLLSTVAPHPSRPRQDVGGDRARSRVQPVYGVQRKGMKIQWLIGSAPGQIHVDS